VHAETASTAVLLAAHGSDTEPGVDLAVRRHAAHLSAAGFSEVGVAFHRGTPSFSTALDDLHARNVVVVPLMTSRGYYSETVLPRELSKNRSFGRFRVLHLEPLGLHREMPTIVAGRVADLEARLSLVEPAVAVVGHGTPRHRESRSSSHALAAALRRRRPEVPVEAFFLDEDPRVEEIPRFAEDRDLVVIPFLIGGGLHARRDLVRRVAPGAARSPVTAERAGGRRIVIDRAVGEDPAVAEVIVDLATRGVSLFAERSSSRRRG
jgi:sirohydrochlorin cobaltochelatase